MHIYFGMATEHYYIFKNPGPPGNHPPPPPGNPPPGNPPPGNHPPELPPALVTIEFVVKVTDWTPFLFRPVPLDTDNGV